MEVESTVRAHASRRRVWEALLDVENWPSWTESVRSAERLDDGPFDIGCRVRVHQPGLMPEVWTVTDIVEGRTFTWVARMPGVRLRTTHTITPLDDALVMLHVTMAQTGLLGRLIGPLTRRRTRKFSEQQAQGLAAYVDGRHKIRHVA